MSKARPLCVLLLLGLGGCQDEGPQTKTTAISERREAVPRVAAEPLTSAERFGYREATPRPAPEAAARVDLTWRAPSSWKELGPNAMRLVSFDLGEGAECYVVRLPGQAGGIEANVNRWRQQMGQPALSPEQIAALPQQQALGVTGVMAELEGTFTGMGGGEGRPGYKLLGLILTYRGYTVFVKLTGPAAVVDANRGGFLAFCRSLRDRTMGPVPGHAPPPEEPGPVGPAQPVMAGAGGLRWTAPEGWQEAPASSSMRIVTFHAPTPGGAPAECIVSALHDAAGGVEANLQRWRGQLGLEPLDEAGLAALPRVEALGQRVALLEAVGAYRGMQGPAQANSYFLGVVVPGEGQTYFVKLVAPGAGGPVQRDAFLAFLKSLRIER